MDPIVFTMFPPTVEAMPGVQATKIPSEEGNILNELMKMPMCHNRNRTDRMTFGKAFRIHA